MIHLDRPNGMSIEVEHSAMASETSSESKTIPEQIVKAGDELAMALKALSGTAPGAPRRADAKQHFIDPAPRLRER
jgi:hypothetical protein